jgi:hypothetical protein
MKISDRFRGTLITLLMKYFLVAISIFFYSEISGQATIKDFYPVAKTFTAKRKSTDISMNSGAGKDISECVSGNCTSGNGTRIIVDWKIPNHLNNAVAEVQVHVGAFTNNGADLKGKIYQLNIPYTQNEYVMTPTLAIDLSDEKSLTPYLFAEGQMKPTLYRKYQVTGTAFNTHLPLALKNVKHSEAIIKEGLIQHIVIQYADSSTLTSYEGLMSGNYYAFFGKMSYKDGSQYQGFLFNNVFFGPGILTTAQGKKIQGIWFNNELAMDTLIGPIEKYITGEAAFDSGKEDFNGNITPKPADGWGVINTQHYLYWGQWKNGKLHGVGAKVPYGYLLNDRFRDGIFWWAGSFKDGNLIYGVKGIQDGQSNDVINGTYPLAYKHFNPKKSWSINLGHLKKTPGDGYTVDTCAVQLRHTAENGMEVLEGRFLTDDPAFWTHIRKADDLTSEGKLVYIDAGIAYDENSPKILDYIFPGMKLAKSQCLALDPAAMQRLITIWETRLETPKPLSYTRAQQTATAEHPCVGNDISKAANMGGWYGLKDIDYIVIGYDCNNNKVICLKRKYTEGRKTTFKTDANTGFYSVELVAMSVQEILPHYKRQENVRVCPVCTGSGVISQDVVHARGGSWEQVNFNISVYTPYREIARWTERAKCPKCSHTGVIPR